MPALVDTPPPDPAPSLGDALRGSRFFRALPAPALEALQATGATRELAAGEELAREDEPAAALCLVLAGALTLGRREGSELGVLAQEGPGAAVGEAALGGGPEPLTAVCAGPVRAQVWSAAELGRAEALAPGLQERLRTALSIRRRAQEITGLLRRSPLFRSTPAALIRRLVRASGLVRFAAGEVVVREGESGQDGLYLVVTGEVAVEREGAPGAPPTHLGVLVQGSSFGELAVLRDAPRSATVVVTRDAELLQVARADFLALQAACPAFRRAIAAVAAQRGADALPALATRAEPWWLVVEGPWDPRRLARLLAEELQASFGERALVAAVLDEARDPRRDQGLDLTLPAAPAALARALDEAQARPGVDYLVCLAAPAGQHALAAALRERAPRVIRVTSGAARPTPGTPPWLLGPASTLHPIAAHAPGSGSAAPAQPGTLRAELPPALPDGLSRASPALRAALGRIARAATDRTVGVALGGGAAWGFAHLPLLRALEAEGVPIDVVAGVSVGSIVGALYASRGLDGLDALEAALGSLTLTALGCLFSSRPATRFMRGLLAHERLEDLPRTFLPLAVDIQRCRERVFRRGPVAEAVRASCSLPGVFGVTWHEGRRYVDGCVMSNVPVSCLIEEGADLVIASNIIPSPPREPGRSGLRAALARHAPWGRVRDALRALFLLYNATGSQQALEADLEFAPELGGFLPVDFHAGRAIAAHAAEQAAHSARAAREAWTALRQRGRAV